MSARGGGADPRPNHFPVGEGVGRGVACGALAPPLRAGEGVSGVGFLYTRTLFRVTIRVSRLRMPITMISTSALPHALVCQSAYGDDAYE